MQNHFIGKSQNHWNHQPTGRLKLMYTYQQMEYNIVTVPRIFHFIYSIILVLLLVFCTTCISFKNWINKRWWGMFCEPNSVKAPSVNIRFMKFGLWLHSQTIPYYNRMQLNTTLIILTRTHALYHRYEHDSFHLQDEQSGNLTLLINMREINK